MGASDWAKEIEAKREEQLDREQKLHEFEAKRLEEKKDAPARIVASQVAEGKTIPQYAEEHPTSSAALQVAQGALATDPDESGELQYLQEEKNEEEAEVTDWSSGEAQEPEPEGDEDEEFSEPQPVEEGDK